MILLRSETESPEGKGGSIARVGQGCRWQKNLKIFVDARRVDTSGCADIAGHHNI
jgi:hypothetical protein